MNRVNKHDDSTINIIVVIIIIIIIIIIGYRYIVWLKVIAIQLFTYTPQNYGTSFAIWYHTALPATRHK